MYCGRDVNSDARVNYLKENRSVLEVSVMFKCVSVVPLSVFPFKSITIFRNSKRYNPRNVPQIYRRSMYPTICTMTTVHCRDETVGCWSNTFSTVTGRRRRSLGGKADLSMIPHPLAHLT